MGLTLVIKRKFF